MTLFLDGEAKASVEVQAVLSTAAHDIALGGNPHFTGNEFLAARFADFRFLSRVLSAAEIKALASRAEPEQKADGREGK